MDILTVENMRESENLCIAKGVPARELMAKAGRAIFNSVKWQPPVAIICGSGNNAGDGYVCATLLQTSGIECHIFLLGDDFTRDGDYFFELSEKAETPFSKFYPGMDLSCYPTILDCIFGTGFHGVPQGLEKEAIISINEAKDAGSFVVSADINSGLNADSGIGECCVHSNLTLSIGGWKTGHFLNMAKDVMDEKRNLDIGIAPAGENCKYVDIDYASQAFPPRLNYSNKSTYGYVTLIGGCREYSGAPKLSNLACASARSGAGVVRLASPKSLEPALLPYMLETVFAPLSETAEGGIKFCEEEIKNLCEHSDAIAFGMGLGRSEEITKTLVYILENYTGRLLIDADGLYALSLIETEKIKNAKCSLLLTPHMGEFSRLCKLSKEEIEKDPIKAAKDYAALTGSVLLLKGPSTIVTDGHQVAITDAGCSGMATGGSGDVLSGICLAMIAYNEDLLQAASSAAFVNGKAGEAAEQKYGAVSMIASDTVNFIAPIIQSLSCR